MSSALALLSQAAAKVSKKETKGDSDNDSDNDSEDTRGRLRDAVRNIRNAKTDEEAADAFVAAIEFAGDLASD